MKTVVEKFEYGLIEYQKPSPPDVFILLGEIGLSSDTVDKDFSTKASELKIIGRTIKAMDFLITKVDCDFDGEKINKFSELIYKREAMPVLTKIAGNILAVLIGGEDKKKSSPMPSSSGETQKLENTLEPLTQV